MEISREEIEVLTIRRCLESILDSIEVGIVRFTRENNLNMESGYKFMDSSGNELLCMMDYPIIPRPKETLLTLEIKKIQSRNRTIEDFISFQFCHDKPKQEET